MKIHFCIFLTFTLLAPVISLSLSERNDSFHNWQNDLNEREIEIEDRGLILDAIARKVVENVLAQMPCGWPEYGIPPLAPYYNEELDLEITTPVVESILKLIGLEITGLNDMEIDELKLTYLSYKSVRYRLELAQLPAKAEQFTADTIIDLMEQYGIRIRVNGSGELEALSLENLSISGSFNYKMPFIFGSVEIYKLRVAINLESCTSKINGLTNDDRFDRWINGKIEKFLPLLINENQEKISNFIEPWVTTKVNDALKGKKIWSILRYLFTNPPTCIPPIDPWTFGESQLLS